MKQMLSRMSGGILHCNTKLHTLPLQDQVYELSQLLCRLCIEAPFLAVILNDIGYKIERLREQCRFLCH